MKRRWKCEQVNKKRGRKRIVRAFKYKRTKKAKLSKNKFENMTIKIGSGYSWKSLFPPSCWNFLTLLRFPFLNYFLSHYLAATILSVIPQYQIQCLRSRLPPCFGLFANNADLCFFIVPDIRLHSTNIHITVLFSCLYIFVVLISEFMPHTLLCVRKNNPIHVKKLS